jgi:hypothetical protein
MELSLSITTLIFLFIVCLCGGIVIGAMFGRAKKAPPQEQPAPEEKEEKEPAPVQKSPAVDGDIEILRAWQNRSGKTWLEMDGQRLENKEAMQAEQKKKLLGLVLDLRPWLDAPPASASAPIPAPKPQIQETPRPVISRPSIFSPRPPKEQKPKEEKPKVNLKSIVEQVDEVLQQKLTGTIFEEQDIHLLEGPAGAVIVQIKNDKFEGIDAVPNPEIKELIRQAVTEWEKGSR